MIPQHILADASQRCLDSGVRLLQGFRLADTDAGHIARLLEYMNPRANSLWVDVGSGFGEAAQLMCEQRPDLSFFLLNNSRFQLEHSAPDFRRLDADMHAIPLGDGCVDGCMFLYALCHADNLAQVLREAARVTMPGGQLFVFDYERVSGDNQAMRRHLFAEAIAFADMEVIAALCGWQVTLHVNPDGDDTLFRSLCPPEVYAAALAGVKPCVWSATRT